MKKIRSVGLSLLLVLGGCSKVAQTGTSNESERTLHKLTQAYIDSNQESYAYEIAYTLAYDEAYLSNSLGFRTAGSKAEHAASDYIASEMNALGLTVEKIPVTVDLWEFTDASLTIEGTDISIQPASYAVNGTDEEGIHAEIIDLGEGLLADYEDVDVTGKIVLAGVDQWNTGWINQYLSEAEVHGAAALVTYDIGGYATYSDDMINMQDVCCWDSIPCVSISYNQYLEIANSMNNGTAMANLIVDNVMVPEGGTSYNVVGKLEGKNHDQQIIISGHYDVYFNGFQDDSCAIGLVLGIAKGMKDSGYTPENDILFIAHGSEEWGATGTEFDWTTGAWELINTVNPEWAEKTIAMINFELPAFYDNAQQSQISCVPEYAGLVKTLVNDSGLLQEPVNQIYPEGISDTSVDSSTMEDGVSYRGAGIPYFINIPGTQDGEDGWIQQHYHTASDSEETYNADVMATNLNTYGTLAIYLDQMPAIALDFEATCEDLEEVDLGNDEAYTEAIAQFRTAASAHNARIADINERYLEAVAQGADEDTIEEIRAEGRACNKVSLNTFKAVQDGLIGIIFSSDIVIRHTAYLANIEVLEMVIDALKNGDLSNEDQTGALDTAWMLNGGKEYGYYLYSIESNQANRSLFLEELNEGNMFWGTGKGSGLVDTYEATVSVLSKAEDENPDFSAEIAIYQKALTEQQIALEETMKNETASIYQIIDLLSVED